jgi:hypothetical protein
MSLRSFIVFSLSFFVCFSWICQTALEDVHPWIVPADSLQGRAFQAAVAWARSACRARWFKTLVTATIALVAVWIGVETDQFLHCERFKVQEALRLARGVPAHAESWCHDGPLPASVAMAVVGQAVFTWECGVKIVAEGVHPLRYFRDPEAGNWNCLGRAHHRLRVGAGSLLRSHAPPRCPSFLSLSFPHP